MNRLLLLLALILSSFSLSAQALEAKFSVDTSYRCLSSTPFNFHDLSTGPNPIVSWYWTFGDGNVSTQQSPSHVYNGRGSRNVTLKVKDSHGDSAVITKVNAIYALPVLLVSSRIYGCANGAPLEIKTEGSADADVVALQSYNWSTGATTPDITVSPVSGVYKLAVTACGWTIADSAVAIVDTGYAVIRPISIGGWNLDSYRVSMSAGILYRDEDYGLTHWSWGDGAKSENNAVWQNAQHSYTAPGNYTISCGVTLNSYVAAAPCADTISFYQLSVPAPNVHHNSWNKRDTTILAGDTLWLGGGNAGAKYKWTFDKNSFISADSVLAITTYNYGNDALYNLYTSKGGDTIRDDITVHVTEDSLLARIKVDSNNCNIVSFADNTFSKININHWEWSFGDGTIDSVRNPVHTYANDGTYNVRLIVGDVRPGVPLTLDTAYATVVALSAPAVRLISDTVIRAGSSIYLTNLLHDEKYSYRWSTGETSSYVFVSDAGYYSLRANYCGKSAIDTVHIDVVPLDTPRVHFRYTQMSAYPYTVSFTGEITPASAAHEDSIMTVSWDFGNSYPASNKLVQDVQYEPGTYLVTLTATSLNGARGKFEQYITISGDTVTLNTGTVNGNDSLPITATFNHDFNTGNVFTAELMLDNSGGRNTGLDAGEVVNLGSVSGTSRNVVMNVAIPDSLACASNYIIRITASSPADTTSWSKQFSIINQPPQPVITQHGDSLFTSGIYNWQWYKNNVAIDGATYATYRARANGTYKVEATNGSGCVSMSSALSVVITAVGEVTLGDNKAKIFPNPSEGEVYLQFSKPLLKTVTVNVHNLQGRVMYTRTTRQQLQTLDLGNLPKGIYLVEISGYGTQKVLTIVLQ